MRERRGATGTSYVVALRGEVGPALLAACCALGVGHVATSSVFLVSLPDGQGVCDIAGMLHAHGLEILDIRQVQPPAVEGLTRGG
jgi:hypothetical protein